MVGFLFQERNDRNITNTLSMQQYTTVSSKFIPMCSLLSISEASLMICHLIQVYLFVLLITKVLKLKD